MMHCNNHTTHKQNIEKYRQNFESMHHRDVKKEVIEHIIHSTLYINNN